MSDFLDFLLKRSLAEKPAIQPRLPGIFESDRPAEAETPGWELTEQIDAQPIATASRIPAPVVPPGQPSADEPQQPAIQVTPPGQAPPFISPPTGMEASSSITPPELLIPPAAPRRVEQFEPLNSPPSYTSTETGKEVMPASDQPPAPLDTGPILSPFQGTKIDLRPAELRETGLDVIQAASHLTTPPVEPPAASPLTPLNPLPAEVVLSLEARRSTADDTEQSDQNEPTPSSPQPPRLTVHIGRIEIRMTQPAGSAQARRSVSQQRKPVMSLDAYLKQRSGEKT